MSKLVHNFTLDGDGLELVEAATVGPEVREHASRYNLRVVRIVILQILVPHLAGDGTKKIDNTIVGGFIEGAVI